MNQGMESGKMEKASATHHRLVLYKGKKVSEPVCSTRGLGSNRAGCEVEKVLLMGLGHLPCVPGYSGLLWARALYYYWEDGVSHHLSRLWAPSPRNGPGQGEHAPSFYKGGPSLCCQKPGSQQSLQNQVSEQGHIPMCQGCALAESHGLVKGFGATCSYTHSLTLPCE